LYPPTSGTPSKRCPAGRLRTTYPAAPSACLPRSAAVLRRAAPGDLPHSRPTLRGLPYRTYPTADLPYSRPRPAPPPRLGRPQGRGRLPHTARSRADARAQDWNPRASRLASLVARGRFLEIPIQNGRAEVGRTRGTDPANAAGHNNVGGYMRGKKTGLEEKKTARRATAASPTHTPPGRLHPPSGPGATCSVRRPAAAAGGPLSGALRAPWASAAPLSCPWLGHRGVLARGLLGLSGHPRARDCSITSPAANARTPRSPRALTRVLR
jgi:hypothetical protein